MLRPRPVLCGGDAGKEENGSNLTGERAFSIALRTCTTRSMASKSMNASAAGVKAIPQCDEGARKLVARNLWLGISPLQRNNSVICGSAAV